MAEPNIKLNRDGAIATVTINCAERRNAITDDIVLAMIEAIRYVCFHSHSN